MCHVLHNIQNLTNTAIIYNNKDIHTMISLHNYKFRENFKKI